MRDALNSKNSNKLILDVCEVQAKGSNGRARLGRERPILGKERTVPGSGIFWP